MSISCRVYIRQFLPIQHIRNDTKAGVFLNLPIYFAVSENEEAPDRADYPLAMFFSPHSQQRPELAIADDRAPSSLPPERYAEQFSRFAETAHGVFFDFERPLNGYWVEFLQQVMHLLPDHFFLAPEAYAPVCGNALIVCHADRPQNIWQRFCAEKQEKYPDRWALEVIPYQFIYRAHCRKAVSYNTLRQLCTSEERYLEQAMCMSCRTVHEHLVYDTAQTLRDRVETACQAGCRLAIGLWSELQYYF